MEIVRYWYDYGLGQVDHWWLFYVFTYKTSLQKSEKKQAKSERYDQVEKE